MRSAILGLTLLAGGCSAPPEACLLPAQHRMLVVSLYFGRDVPGRGPVTDAEWARFASEVLGRQFSSGFTVLDATGQWRNPATGSISREATKMVQVGLPANKAARAKIEAVSRVYKQMFKQEAVGIVSSQACGVF